MKLSDRVFNCQKCGHVQDRDENASINLENAPSDRVRLAWPEFTPGDWKEPTPQDETGKNHQTKFDKVWISILEQYNRLLAKSVLGETTSQQEERIKQLEEYLTTVDEVDATLEETSQRYPDLDKEECYNVYQY